MLKYLNKINFFAFDRKSNDNNNCVCKKKKYLSKSDSRNSKLIRIRFILITRYFDSNSASL